jgi:hypothetical protein
MKCILHNKSEIVGKYSYEGVYKAYSNNFFESNVKLYNFKHFVLNKFYTNSAIIRLIVQKI